MGLLDFFSGGKSKSASDALARAERAFSKVRTPTAEELTLPELQKYVEAGILTPAQAMSYLQDRNAYENMDIPQTGTQSMVEALNRMSEIADAGAEGTPIQRAQMENTLARMRSEVGGQRGAIEQAMAARGTPYALIQAALSNQTVGQEAQQAHLDAVNAQAAAYQAALNAMSQGGALGGQLQGMQNQQANTVAQAANAMQQFNAANQQDLSKFNATNRQAANAYNAANRQNISNQNVGLENERTRYNVGVPQQVFANAMEKAKGMAGAATNIGNLYQQQGQQNAGIMSGLIDLGASFIPKPQTASATKKAHGGIIEDPEYCAADGMMIPGDADYPGDTEMNDTVPIMASPGEAVIPRSTVAENPEMVDSLLSGEADVIDSRDVATLLKAMRAIRVGAV